MSHTQTVSAGARIRRGARRVVFIAAATAMVSVSGGASARYLSPADVANARAAARAIAAGNYAQGTAIRARIGDPAVRKLVAWYAHTRRGSQSRFEEITRFIRDNGDWPWAKQLRRNAEAAVRSNTDPGAIIAFYRNDPPVTPTGQMLAVDRLFAAGRKVAAVRLIRDIWAKRYIRYAQSLAFMKRYAQHLRPEDHYNRLDYLLYVGHKRSARGLIKQVKMPEVMRSAIYARLMMNLGRHYCGRRRGPYTAVTARLSRVPYKLARGEGHSFNAMRFYSCAGRIRLAMRAMATQPSKPRFPKLWWRERSKLARDAIRARQYRTAYEIARGHRQYGAKLHAHAEWFAGFIAFRLLKNHARADQHFRGALASVESAWTRAKILYWHGRLRLAQGRPKEARTMFAAAAKYATTFYGQLAHGKVAGGKPPLLIGNPGRPTDPAFWRDDMVKAMIVARRIGLGREAWSLTRHIMLHRAKTPAQHMYAVAALNQMTSPAKRRQLNVRVIKYAQYKGHPVVGKGYPTIALPKANTVEPALIYALIRQESEFQPHARSWAGARGYMQLMPFTAAREAKDLRLRYRRAYLTRRPAYNLRLGTHHVSRLLTALRGAYPMVLAAYNAGEHRVNQWVAWHGDPRARGGPDWPTWIELIKFDETRAYVKRVLEGHTVYRILLRDHIDTRRLTAYWKPQKINRRRACAIVLAARKGNKKTVVASGGAGNGGSSATLASRSFGLSLIIKPKKAAKKASETSQNPLALIERRPHDNIPGSPDCG